MAHIIRTQKIKAGIYKVITNAGIYMVRGGINYNPDSEFFRNGGYEIWTSPSNDECSDLNCWACGAPSKKIALQYIQELN